MTHFPGVHYFYLRGQPFLSPTIILQLHLNHKHLTRVDPIGNNHLQQTAVRVLHLNGCVEKDMCEEEKRGSRSVVVNKITPKKKLTNIQYLLVPGPAPCGHCTCIICGCGCCCCTTAPCWYLPCVPTTLPPPPRCMVCGWGARCC